MCYANAAMRKLLTICCMIAALLMVGGCSKTSTLVTDVLPAIDGTSSNSKFISSELSNVFKRHQELEARGLYEWAEPFLALIFLFAVLVVIADLCIVRNRRERVATNHRACYH